MFARFRRNTTRYDVAYVSSRMTSNLDLFNDVYNVMPSYVMVADTKIPTWTVSSAIGAVTIGELVIVVHATSPSIT